MSENRFVAEQVDVVNEDETEVWDIVFDTENTYAFMVRDTDTASGLCDLLNEQQSRIKELEKEKVELMEDCACQYRQIQKLESENEDLREVNKENQLLHEENVKQCERWRNLYELKDAEVTARVDGLNKVCEYYTSEVLFKSDVDPNKAVREVINEILNTEVEM